MKHILPALLLFSTITIHAQQLQEHSFTGGLVENGLNSVVSPGGVALSGYSVRGNYDSVYMHLLLVDTGSQVVHSKAWKTTAQPGFLNNMIAFDGGYLFAGDAQPNFGDTHPYIFKTNDTGTVQWAHWFKSLPYSQHQVNAMVANGNNFTAYGYPDGPTGGFTRLDGNSSGTSITAQSVEVSNASIRVYNATVFNGGDDHLLTGTGSMTGGNGGSDAMLTRMSSTELFWSNAYDFGKTGEETFTSAVHTSDGEVVAVGYSQNVSSVLTPSIIMKTDSDGIIEWSKMLTLPGGLLELFSVTTTPDENLLACGINGAYHGVLVKLDKFGGFIWAKEWTPVSGLGYFSHVYYDTTASQIVITGTNNGFLLIRTDADASTGCGFTDIDNLDVIDSLPVVHNFNTSVSSYTADIQIETLTERTATILNHDICHPASGIAELETAEAPILFPNISTGDYHIYFPAVWQSTPVTLSVFDVSGKKVYSTTLHGPDEELSLRTIAAGMYFVQCNSGVNYWCRKVVKE